MIFWLLALGVLISDQLTKAAIKSELTLGRTIPIVHDRFHITYVKNPGGAFGLMPHGQVFFLLASVTVLIIILAYKVSRKPPGLLINAALALIFGGTAGNLLDRLLYGQVIDWLDFRFWPVFNFADTALVVGLALFSLSIMRAHEDGGAGRE